MGAGVSARFWEKVQKTETCWLWLACVTPAGYGQINIAGRRVLAHRFAYEQAHGPIPDGLTLDHYRMNPGPRHAPCSTVCVNPDHLEAVTHRINVLRGNSPMALQSRQTCCRRGHPFDAVLPNGKRRCLRCNARRQREFLARRAA